LRTILIVGDRKGECEILSALGTLCNDVLGQHMEADAHLAQALAIALELGDQYAECRIRASQGRNALRQGDVAQAKAALLAAQSAADKAGDPLGLGLAAYGLGLVAYYQGENELARDCAQSALETARQTEQRRGQRFALGLLGHALEGLGQVAFAAVIFQQVLDLDQTIGHPRLVFETMANVARVALVQGDQDRAIGYVVTILDGLQDCSLTDVEDPVQVYLTCYQVLKSGLDPRAEALLAAGHTVMTNRAIQCSPSRRRLFLESIPANRTLQQLWDQSRFGHVGDDR
jgi:tetratricopeptide (TPR) repeat protein